MVIVSSIQATIYIYIFIYTHRLPLKNLQNFRSCLTSIFLQTSSALPPEPLLFRLRLLNNDVLTTHNRTTNAARFLKRESMNVKYLQHGHCIHLRGRRESMWRVTSRGDSLALIQSISVRALSCDGGATQ